MAKAKAVASVTETNCERLDWREEFKKRPVAWSLGAAGGGFLLGYALAGTIAKKPDGHSDAPDYGPTSSRARAAVPMSGHVPVSSAAERKSDHQRNERRQHQEAKEARAGLLERFQETEAYDQIRREAAAVGSRLISEVSQTAREVVLPAAISWLRQWLSGLASPAPTDSTASKTGSPIPSETNPTFRSS